jgi:integrase/recombinase XerD
MTNLTQSEFDAVVALALANDERHAAFILFSYYHAARRQEALALRGTDVINGTVRFKRAKQKQDPIISVQPLFRLERELLEKYAVQAGSGRVFPYSAGYASRMMRRYLTQAGAYTHARQKSLHSLRHSAGDKMYRANRDIVAVAKWLGHKNIESSRRYTHLNDAEVNAMAAVAL